MIDSSQTSIESHIKTDRLNDRVVIISLGNDHLEAVCAIKTQNGIVIIDAGLSYRLTTLYRHTIEKIFGWNNFAYLIITHAHPDHIGGNGVFQEALMIGHENTTGEIPASRTNHDKLKSGLKRTADNYSKQLIASETGSDEWIRNFCQNIRYASAHEDCSDDQKQRVPDITFSNELNLFTGDLTFNMIHFGTAHSASDIVIHIPELKLLFTGDLFGPGGFAFVGKPNKHDAEHWVTAMEWIRKRRNNINTIIGGHGERMTLNDLELFEETMIEKLQDIK